MAILDISVFSYDWLNVIHLLARTEYSTILVFASLPVQESLLCGIGV